jgi:hypothetical protein
MKLGELVLAGLLSFEINSSILFSLELNMDMPQSSTSIAASQSTKEQVRAFQQNDN